MYTNHERMMYDYTYGLHSVGIIYQAQRNRVLGFRKYCYQMYYTRYLIKKMLHMTVSSIARKPQLSLTYSCSNQALHGTPAGEECSVDWWLIKSEWPQATNCALDSNR